MTATNSVLKVTLLFERYKRCSSKSPKYERRIPELIPVMSSHPAGDRR